jgi:hypothetical protein
MTDFFMVGCDGGYVVMEIDGWWWLLKKMVNV